MISIKHELFNHCQHYVTSSINTIQQAIAAAQAAANDETKSSAGDKYETTRAMMQIEIENNTTQLANFEKLRQVLNRIDPDKITKQIELGSLVVTNHENFYISISAGKFTINGTLYFAISTASPLGSKLIGKSVGNTAQIDKREYIIKEVH